MRILCTAVAASLALASAQIAEAGEIRPHFPKPWRERVADAQAAYLANPEAFAPRLWTVPTQPVISANERWEVDGLLLAWHCESNASSPGSWDRLWLDIIDAAWDGADLYIYIITDWGSDADDVARCKLMLEQQRGRDPAQAVWFNETDDHALDSIWIRDYGPFFVFDDAGDVSIVDADYERHGRTRDDAQPSHFASWWGVPRHEWAFVTEGGNFLPNGNGICLVSETIYGLNPGLDAAEIEDQYATYLGCTDLIVLPAVDDVTGHVDMWITWIDETTLAVGEYTAQQDPGSRAVIEQAVSEQLTGLVDPASEETVEVVRIPMPSNSGGYVWRTYTNGIWIDDAYLMPVYDGYEGAQAEATAALEARGVTVIPIDSDVIISSAGALHCISKTIAAPPTDPGGGDSDIDRTDVPSDPAMLADDDLPADDPDDGDDDDDRDGGVDVGCALSAPGPGEDRPGSAALLILLAAALLAVVKRRRRRR